MRIGLETSALAVDLGGTAAYVTNLLDGLTRLGRRHEIVTFSFRTRARARKSLARRMETLRRDFLWAQLALPLAARRRRLGILHLTGAAMPIWSDCPRVVTVHDVGPFRHRAFFTPWMAAYARVVQAQAIRRAEAVIAISRFVAGDLARTLGIPEGRITVVHQGVSKRFFISPPAACLAGVRARFRLERPFILHMGVLSPRKNLARLIDAYWRLRQAGRIDHQLVLAGGRGWRDGEVMQRAARLDPAGRDIRLIGHVPDSDLPALYRLADLLVYPSLYEGFGLPPLEAMACGTPVVASDRAAIPEVLGDAALLVDPTDEAALAEGMRRVLMCTALRRELGERGCKRAAGYTWERTVRRTLEVYGRVVR
jgi:glycosyltransferase involved in cell wall biosynthesis